MSLKEDVPARIASLITTLALSPEGLPSSMLRPIVQTTKPPFLTCLHSRRAQYDVRDGIQASLPPYAPLSQPSNNPEIAETAANLEANNLNSSTPRERPACLPDQLAVDEPADFHHRDTDQRETQLRFPEYPENPVGSSNEQPSSLQGKLVSPGGQPLAFTYRRSSYFEQHVYPRRPAGAHTQTQQLLLDEFPEPMAYEWQRPRVL